MECFNPYFKISISSSLSLVPDRFNTISAGVKGSTTLRVNSLSFFLCVLTVVLTIFQSCYIGETKRHLPTRIKEHLQTDKKSHILQHLNENPNCRDLCDDSCFTIIDHASSSFRLKLKEALHITWLKPVLNKQKNHVSITISV